MNIMYWILFEFIG